MTTIIFISSNHLKFVRWESICWLSHSFSDWWRKAFKSVASSTFKIPSSNFTLINFNFALILSKNFYFFFQCNTWDFIKSLNLLSSAQYIINIFTGAHAHGYNDRNVVVIINKCKLQHCEEDQIFEDEITQFVDQLVDECRNKITIYWEKLINTKDKNKSFYQWNNFI